MSEQAEAFDGIMVREMTCSSCTVSLPTKCHHETHDYDVIQIDFRGDLYVSGLPLKSRIELPVMMPVVAAQALMDQLAQIVAANTVGSEPDDVEDKNND